jgi:hypothetical protein
MHSNHERLYAEITGRTTHVIESNNGEHMDLRSNLEVVVRQSSVPEVHLRPVYTCKVDMRGGGVEDDVDVENVPKSTP